MREILFRGKTEDGEWAYAEPVLDGKYVKPETIGQYTGLVDSEGNKIFEGDIVRTTYVHPDVYVVKFDEDRCGYFPFACGDGCGCCESETEQPGCCVVIGNIYDNPNLLEEIKNEQITYP